MLRVCVERICRILEARETKVGELDAPVVGDEEVLALEIAMNDGRIVHVKERLEGERSEHARRSPSPTPPPPSPTNPLAMSVAKLSCLKGSRLACCAASTRWSEPRGTHSVTIQTFGIVVDAP